MAEENSNAAVVSERIRREVVNPRRKSTGPSSSSSLALNSLRASTGSCHDMCKFGKVHSCQPKARNPLRRKQMTRPPEDEILVKSAVFPEKKNSPVNRPKSSPSSHIPVLEAPDILKQKVLKSSRRNLLRGLVSEKKMSPAVTVKPSLNSSTLSLNSKKLMKKDLISSAETSRRSLPNNGTLKQAFPINETLKRGLPIPKERRLPGSPHGHERSSPLPFRRLSSSGSSSLSRLQKRAEIKPQNSTGLHKKAVTKKVSVLSTASPPSKPSISKKTTVKSIKGAIVSKRITSNGPSPRKSKDKVKEDEAARVSNKEESIEKTSYVVNGEENPSVEETESKTSEPVTKESIDEGAIVNIKETESMPLESVSSEGIDESNIVNVKATDSKVFEEASSEVVVESNIVHVKETDTKPLELVAGESFAEIISPPLPLSIAESLSLSPSDSLSPSLPEEDQTESEYTVIETENSSASENEESDLMHGGEASEEGNGKTPHRNGGNHLPASEEGSKPRKVQFRRGRIIDVWHAHNTPRRLRFRQGGLLGETQNLNAGPRKSSLKRREQIEGEDDKSGTKGGSAIVVLRHSDVQEKKDLKVSFNNVIEETASKLAETRKSKVKALVGAFETVISLQDSKPSANT